MEISKWRETAQRLGKGRTARILAIILAAVAGGWLGLAVGASVDTPVGPADIGMSLRPSWSGETVVDVRPLGTLSFDTHNSPVRLSLTIDAVHPEAAQEILNNPRWADRLPTIIGQDVTDGLRRLVIRGLLFAAAAGFLTGLVVFRRISRAAWTGAGSLVMVVVMGGVAALTFNPRSISEPRYTGLLTGVPSLVGSAQSIVTRFSEYRGQLAKLVTNVSQLYEAGSTLPIYDPDPSTIRVLHVSDLHINPIAWNVIESLKDQFKVNLVIDTGDISDHGTSAEDKFVEEIGRLGVPYVYVRGNHDAMSTQRAVAKQKNAIVLDGNAATVGGLRIFGIGDPRFTPDKSVQQSDDTSQALIDLGRAQAAKIAPPETPRSASTSSPDRIPADIVAVHDPTVGRGVSGQVALVLAGHVHQRSTEMLPTGTRLMIQGSTGGAGLRGLEGDEPTPLMASVLYFNKSTHRLQAWDDITIGGFGEQRVQVERHIEPDPGRRILPESSSESTTPPQPSGTITGSPSPIALASGAYVPYASEVSDGRRRGNRATP
ncbi:metallophosphoesterase family protein [Planotetraspora kaengkrachanensis]|uniref:Membrane protein n=1 Tax=Planotetraspora kaengkrachanensis TaxID=575193 RepID=A0A8J3Q010_9ACTN|nr:metallophosphoesterase [Planotetraspora kaengkrachanensis]GIG84080.1 membrane protein [Planotetraspora kaengkrachanensis]